MITIKSFYVDTTKGLDVLNIVHEVRRVIREANVQNGSVTVVIPAPGAATVVMEVDVKVDELKKGLEPYLSNGLIRCLLPRSLVMTVEKGRMSIEPWQEIFLIDYETMGRRREFRVQVETEPPPAKEPGREKR